ncbi:Alpha/Beta hydrolase protein [Entophlyctis helioformis]|nr:Alpha/Beta hydrolase protein [Entophlyctis helioformis]
MHNQHTKQSPSAAACTPRSAFRPSPSYPLIALPPAPPPSTMLGKLSHSLPLPMHLALASASTAASVSTAVLSHMLDGPVRSSWNLLTTLTHAAMKSVMVNHPPQGRHSLGIVRLATQFSVPAFMFDASVEQTSVLVRHPEQVSALVKEALDVAQQPLTNTVDYAGMHTRYVPGEWVRHKSLGPLPADSVAASDEPVILYLHGGAHIFMSPRTHRVITSKISQACGASVFAADYRLALDGPFPSAIEDALACYLALTGLSLPTDDSGIACQASFRASQSRPSGAAPAIGHHRPVSPSRIFVMGDSSGGCLSLQLMQTLKSLNLPMPAGIAMLSPFLDHEIKSASFHNNWNSDFLSLDLDGIDWAMKIYANGLPRGHPAISPLNGKLWGLPPMLIQSGDSEVVTDDAVELQIYKDMFHVFHSDIPVHPQSSDAMDRIGQFVRTFGPSAERDVDSAVSVDSSETSSDTDDAASVSTPSSSRTRATHTSHCKDTCRHAASSILRAHQI